MHTRTIVQEKIRQHLVTTVLNGDARGLSEHTDLIAGGVLDSFSVIELILFVQQEFHWHLEPARVNANSLRSIAAITDMVCGTNAPAVEQDANPAPPAERRSPGNGHPDRR